MDKRIPIILVVLGMLVLGVGVAQQQGCHVPDVLPIPGPIVDPVERPGAWIILIEETDEANPAVARVKGHLEYWSNLKNTRQLNYRWLDENQQEAKPYASIVKETGVPALIILSAEGEKLLAKPLPPTIEGIDEAVKKVTGL